jgi:hypothetical protein
MRVDLVGEAHHTEMGGKISIVPLRLRRVVCDTSEKSCHGVSISRFPKSIQESKAVCTIVLYHTLLSLKSKIQQERKGKVEDVVVPPYWN